MKKSPRLKPSAVGTEPFGGPSAPHRNAAHAPRLPAWQAACGRQYLQLYWNPLYTELIRYIWISCSINSSTSTANPVRRGECPGWYIRWTTARHARARDPRAPGVVAVSPARVAACVVDGSVRLGAPRLLYGCSVVSRATASRRVPTLATAM